MKTTVLAEWIEKIGVTFEKANPAMFTFLAAVLPYSTPIPVAWLTMHNASEFLGFPPSVAFIFVFGLEGMGLWFTSLFVDSVVDWIQSRNWKSSSIVLIFGAVVTAYVVLLVNLNVTLEITSGNVNPAYSRIVTLLCFLPLLTGVGNGYYKMKVVHKSEVMTEKERKQTLEEKTQKEKSDERNRRWNVKHGVKDAVYNSSTPTVSRKSGDWRLLTRDERHEVIHVLTPAEIIKKYNVGRSTAFEWKRKSE